MKKSGLAFIAAAALTVLGSITANALPFPPTLFQPVAGVPGAFEDNLFVFKLGTGVLENRGVTTADINACSNVIAGGCFFTVPNGANLPFDLSQQGRFTLVYESDGVTLSDAFGLTCDDIGCNLAYLTQIGEQPFDLTGIDTSNFYAVNEVAGAPVTVFDATYYLAPAYRQQSPGVFARFVSSEVPEPATLTLFGAGIAGVAAMRRRKKRN